MKNKALAQLKELFATAVELPPERREDYVQAIADPELRQALRELLEADGKLDGMTARPAVPTAITSAFDGADPNASLGNIGGFALLRMLGHGGMGTVYLAERAVPGGVQRIALKCLYPIGAPAEFERRFHSEIGVLAQLSHPHIARLIDAGQEPDGRCWIAMEFIEGTPLLQYCDERNLPVAARLALFGALCEAVSAAHRSLVVHRDIKSNNVLVREDGELFLIDFGIARALAVPGDITQLEQRFLSPLNAAPEQVRGEATTTACDVYGLGVVLYELLCGVLPIEATQPSVREAVLHQVPPLASSRLRDLERTNSGQAQSVARHRACPDVARLARTLRGDLEQVCAVALRKQPHERYASVDQLLADVRRATSGQPILARGNDRLYRTGRWLRRNAIGVTLASVALVALFIGLALLWLQARSLERERDHARAQTLLAQQQGRRAEFVTTFLLEAFAQADPSHTMGQTLTAKQILDAGVRQLRSADDSDPESLVRIAITLAEVEHGLGLYDEGDELIDFSKARLATISNPTPAVIAAQHYVEAVRLARNSKFKQAKEESEAGLALLDKQDDAWSERHWVALKAQLARALIGTDDVAGALAIRRELVASIDKTQWLRRDDAWSLRIELATQLNLGADTRGEARSITEGVLRELAAAQATDTPTNARALSEMSSIEKRSENYKSSLDYAEKSLETYQKFYDAEHAMIGRALQTLANAEQTANEPKRALEHYSQALRIYERTGLSSIYSVGIAFNMAIVYDESLHDYAKAEHYLRQAIEGFRNMYGNEHRNVFIAEEGLANVLIESNRYNEAGPLLEGVLRNWEKVEPIEENLSATRCAIALVRHAQGKDNEATELLQSNLASFRKYADSDNYMLARAESLAKLLNVQVEPAK